MFVVRNHNEQPRVTDPQEMSLVTKKKDTSPPSADLSDDSSSEGRTSKPSKEATSSPSKQEQQQQPRKSNHDRRVQHNYHDHMHDKPPAYLYDEEVLGNGHCFTVSSTGLGGAGLSFTIKLHEMLNTVEREESKHIVSWQPHGRCFVIHKIEMFKELLPRFFGINKIASFQRQLNMYGFQRITRGVDKGGYYHELFLRGRVFLAYQIRRVRIKGTGARAKANPEQEPNFWEMAWLEPLDFHDNNSSKRSSIHQLPSDARRYSSEGRIELHRSRSQQSMLRDEKPWFFPQSSPSSSTAAAATTLTMNGDCESRKSVPEQQQGSPPLSFRQQHQHHPAIHAMNRSFETPLLPASQHALPLGIAAPQDMRQERTRFSGRIVSMSSAETRDLPPTTITPPRGIVKKVMCWGMHFHPVDNGVEVASKPAPAGGISPESGELNSTQGLPDHMMSSLRVSLGDSMPYQNAYTNATPRFNVVSASNLNNDHIGTGGSRNSHQINPATDQLLGTIAMDEGLMLCRRPT
ncbi:hypothetical protein ACA910_000402 [Epithemia clementina (nom. ined.)]